MIVTLELPEKLEAALQSNAQAQGVSMEQNLLMLAERDMAGASQNRYPLRGLVMDDQQPLEPVAEQDWNAV